MVKIVKIAGHDWYLGQGSQSVAISKLSSCDMVLAMHHRKHGRGWTAMNANETLDAIATNNYLYEVILDRRRKVYFDIDSERDCLQECVDAILEVMPDAEINVSGSEPIPNSVVKKYSYHICVSNYHLNNLNETAGLKGWTKLKSSLGFDWKVYTSNRQMKFINQSKLDGRVQSYISGSRDLRDHVISAFIKKDSRDAYDLFEEFVDYDEPVIFNKLPQKKMVLGFDKNVALLTNEDIINIIPRDVNHRVTFTVALFMAKSGCTFEEFWNWTHSKGNTKDRFVKWRDTHWPMVMEITKNGDNRVTRETIIRILERFYPYIRKEYITRVYLEYSKLPLDVDTREEYVPLDCFTDRYVDYLVYPMGAGKTMSVTNYVNTRIESSIFLNCRISLAQNIIGRLSEKFIKYDDVPALKDLLVKFDPAYKNLNARGTIMIKQKAIPLCDYLVTTPNSLHYIGDRNYDIVVIDEFEMYQRNWTAMDIHKEHYSENWKTSIRLLKNAKKVIIMDALPSYNTILFLDRIGINRDHVSVIGSSFQYPKLDVRFIKDVKSPQSNVETFLKYLLKDLVDGKKVYLFWPYKTPKGIYNFDMDEVRPKLNRLSVTEIAMLLDRHLRLYNKGRDPLKYLIYNSDTMNDSGLKSGLKDVNVAWKDIDLVITNQAITIGVNFDLPDVFDCVYIGKSSFVSPREIIQTSRRVRHLKEQKIYITNLGGMPTKSLIIDRYPKDLDYLGETIMDVNRELLANNDVILRWMFEKANMPVMLTSEDRVVLTELHDEFIKCDVSYCYENIDDIEMFEEYERLIISGAASTDDVLKLTKWKFKRLFRSDTDDSILSTLWNSRSLVHQLNKFQENVDDFIHTVFEYIGCDIGDEFPTDVKLTPDQRTSIIKRMSFNRINPDKSSSMYILAEYINGYFNYPVYSYIRESNKWRFNDNFLYLSSLWLNNKKVKRIDDDGDPVTTSPNVDECLI